MLRKPSLRPAAGGRRAPAELVLLAFAALLVVALTVLALSRLATDTLERACDARAAAGSSAPSPAGC